MFAALRAIVAGIAESVLEFLRNAATKSPVDTAPSDRRFLRRVGGRIRGWMRPNRPG